MNQMMIDFLLRCAFIHFSRLFCEFEPTGKNKPFYRLKSETREKEHTDFESSKSNYNFFIIIVRFCSFANPRENRPLAFNISFSKRDFIWGTKSGQLKWKMQIMHAFRKISHGARFLKFRLKTCEKCVWSSICTPSTKNFTHSNSLHTHPIHLLIALHFVSAKWAH